MSVNEDGLCKKCQPVFYSDLAQHVRILEECIEIIENSKKIDTILSRIDVGLKCLAHLQQYEALRIPTIQPPPSEAMENWKERRIEKVLEVLNKQLIEARSKSENAKTVAGKTNPFNKVLEQVTKHQIELEDIGELQKFEHEVRKELANTFARAHIHEAEKAKFKGQQKKAIDRYLDALFSIRSDDVKDAEQSDLIQKIESEIHGLGGSVPN